MEEKKTHCTKCGAARADQLEFCEFCGEKKTAVKNSAAGPPVKAASESLTPAAVKTHEPAKESNDFDFVRATQRTILIMLSGVFLFLCPVPVHPFYKVLAAVSAFLGLWAPALFRAFGAAAMASAAWMSWVVYEQGCGTRQLFTEKDYYSQGAKGPIPEWALFKKTLFQSLSGFEWVCLFAACAGAAYIFWVGFYAFQLRKAKTADVKK